MNRHHDEIGLHLLRTLHNGFRYRAALSSEVAFHSGKVLLLIVASSLRHEAPDVSRPASSSASALSLKAKCGSDAPANLAATM